MLNFLRSGPATPQLSMKDAIVRAASGELTVIDVRDAGEIRASGTAAGSLHIPLALIPMKADPKSPDYDKRLDPAKPTALLCASGARSGMAAQTLKRLGYGEVHNLGGFGGWASAGGKVSR